MSSSASVAGKLSRTVTRVESGRTANATSSPIAPPRTVSSRRSTSSAQDIPAGTEGGGRTARLWHHGRATAPCLQSGRLASSPAPRHFSAPALWPYERLFFELYGQALQGRPHTAEFLDGITGDWLEPLAAAAVARGIPEPRARAHVRPGIAVTRGLLLDLLATGDREAADQAMDAFIALTESWAAANASAPLRG